MKSYLKDNSGFSLVEIIVAMGISTFVILAVYMLMNSASTTYRDTTEDITGQKEVMQSMNFIFDKLSEAKDYKSYKQTFSASTKEGLVLLVSNTVYEGDTPKDVTSLFVYVPEGELGNIYYMRIDEAYNSLSSGAIDNFVAQSQYPLHLLAEDVKTFEVDSAVMVGNNPIKVTVQVVGERTGSSYSETKVITPRNYKEK